MILLLGLFLKSDSVDLPATPQNLADLIAKEQLEAGDLIFRRGISFVSRLVQVADQQTVYTHVGIVVDYEGEKRVVHAVPSETPDEADKVKMESLHDFLQPERAVELGVYRLNEHKHFQEASAAARWAFKMAQKAIPFDKGFDLQDTSRLYCTELIWKAYLAAGIDLCEGRFDKLPLTFQNEDCILPGRICSSIHLSPIIHLP
jgi:uncharacterized protein YycO